MMHDISGEHFRITQDNSRINKRYLKVSFGRGTHVGFHTMNMMTHDDQGRRSESVWPTNTKWSPWAYSLAKWSIDLDRGFSWKKWKRL